MIIITHATSTQIQGLKRFGPIYILSSKDKVRKVGVCIAEKLVPTFLDIRARVVWERMQVPPSFVSPWTLHFESNHVPLRCRDFSVQPVCTLRDRDSVFRKASLPQPFRREEALNEYLRELRLRYNIYQTEGSPDPSARTFLRDFAYILRTCGVNVKLPLEPSLTNLSIHGEYYQCANRILAAIRGSEPRENAETTGRLLQQPTIIGPVKRRNAFFLGIPHKYLRAHEAFYELPSSLSVELDSYQSLTSLRQDCKPFLAAWQALPLHVNEVWPILGFGEENIISDHLPHSCRGHKHALGAWKKLFAPRSARTGKRTFPERFAHERVANAALSYINAEQVRWKRLAPSAPPWCDAVQLLETGCWMYSDLRVPLSAAPAAQVVRRDESDFWMWRSIDTVLITMAEDMYGSSSGSQCRFEKSKVRDELDLLSWIQAQFTMLCSGRNIRFADVVWYATLGGMSSFRVKRDEIFLEAGIEALERFMVEFVEKGCPPNAGFEQGLLFQKMIERITNRCETVERLSYIAASVAETKLMPWRRRMSDWETQRSEKPFF